MSRDSLRSSGDFVLLGTKFNPRERTSSWASVKVFDDKFVIYFSLLIILSVSFFTFFLFIFLIFLFVLKLWVVGVVIEELFVLAMGVAFWVELLGAI